MLHSVPNLSNRLSDYPFQLAKEVKDLFPFNDPKKNVLANPLDSPEKSANISSDHKVYGPKSFLKKGVLGNYEPDYKIKHGPGIFSMPFFSLTLVSEILQMISVTVKEDSRAKCRMRYIYFVTVGKEHLPY